MVGIMKRNELKLGDRVEVGDQRGTVHYIGGVPPTKGVWLGVDWDDPLRGKHDGVHDGKRYFHARYATSGSLVRLEKVKTGQDILSGVEERYGGTDQQMDSKEIEAIQKAINAPLFMMVGFDKVSEMQSNYDSLTIVGLQQHRISSAGEPGELSRICPNVIELELSRNLLSSWEAVFEIVKQLPKLKLLDLSENRLTYKESNLADLKSGFHKLEFLVLSKVEYTWEDILNCAVMWPDIHRFQISFNKITTLSTPPVDVLHNLSILNIEGNNIIRWSEVEKLGTLPKLSILNISNTGLTNISLSSPNTLFCSLRYILISGNFINSWESISELDKLPKLEELKFRDNPILEGMTRENSRQVVIGRLSRLKMLNAQEIPDEERRGAEIDYLKENGRMWIETALDPKARSVFKTLHPRYQSLVDKYGEMEENELRKEKHELKATLVRVKLESADMKFEKPVPQEMSVRALMFLSQRLFNTGTNKLILTLVSSKNPRLKIPLDNAMKNLTYYSIEENDTITVAW